MTECNRKHISVPVLLIAGLFFRPDQTVDDAIAFCQQLVAVHNGQANPPTTAKILLRPPALSFPEFAGKSSKKKIPIKKSANKTIIPITTGNIGRSTQNATGSSTEEAVLKINSLTTSASMAPIPPASASALRYELSDARRAEANRVSKQDSQFVQLQVPSAGVVNAPPEARPPRKSISIGKGTTDLLHRGFPKGASTSSSTPSLPKNATSKIVVQTCQIENWTRMVAKLDHGYDNTAESRHAIRTVNHNITDRVALIRSDLVKLGVDVIVNSTRQNLSVSEGLCAAIHSAAGPQLL